MLSGWSISYENLSLAMRPGKGHRAGRAPFISSGHRIARHRIVALVAALGCSGQALAANFTAQVLYDDCRAARPVCEAYFAGFSQAAFTYERMRKGLPGVDARFCPSGTVGVGEIKKLFEERMAKYPESLSSPAYAEVFRTLEDAFPCAQPETTLE